MGRTPTFIVIGAARSGTTALYNYLRQHPQVFMSRIKEPNYFAFAGEPLDFAGPGADFVNNSVADRAAYDALFAGASPDGAVGEASPLYLYAPKAAERIRAALPDVRLIVILRNPIEQAYSHYLYARARMIEPIDNFAAALDAEPVRLAAHWQPMFQYSDFPRYGEQLSRYFAHFPREQIKLFLYEDLNRDPMAMLREIFSFIGVDESFVPDVAIRANAGGVPKNALLQSALMRPSFVTRAAAAVLPKDIRQRVRDVVSKRNTRRVAMPDDARRRLSEKLCKDILELQKLIDRDLSGWHT